MASSVSHQLENITHYSSPSSSVLGMANQQLLAYDSEHHWHSGAGILHQAAAAAAWSSYGYGNLNANYCESNVNVKLSAASDNDTNVKLPNTLRGLEGNLECGELMGNLVKTDESRYISAFDNQLYGEIAWGQIFPCQEDFINKVPKDFNSETSLQPSIYSLHPAQRFPDHLLGRDDSWIATSRSPPLNSPNSCNNRHIDVENSRRTNTATVTNVHSHPHLFENSCLAMVEDTKLSTIVEAGPSSDDSMNHEVSSDSRRNSPDTTTDLQKMKKRARDGPKDGTTLSSDAKDIDEKQKRSKNETGSKEDQTNLVEPSVSANSVESIPATTGNPKSQPPEPPKSDYIHVRAKRGQATDSHSLAERIRREKISERMKFLQDLVPGCSKVTGKAVMLDEIINYVQSLQQQVEFLSMKLAAINPRLDFNMESLLGRGVFQPQTMVTAGTYSTLNKPPPLPPLPPKLAQMPTGSSYPSVNSNSPDAELARNINMSSLVSADPYGDSTSQISLAWENELQSVVQHGFIHGNQTLIGASPGNEGQLLSGEMKVEH